MQWQPIETAPKDGTRILVTGEGIIWIASWKEIEIPNDNGIDHFESWVVYECEDIYFNYELSHMDITHWQHLPELPQ